VWHEASGLYLDPATGEVLPSWDQALDAIGPGDEPLHVAQFGQWFDAQGVIAGSRDANRCIGYLTKYLTKHVATQERDEAIAAGMGKLLRQARRKARTATGGAGTESASGTQRARGRKRAS
jgi:Replication initiator protein, pSAM2